MQIITNEWRAGRVENDELLGTLAWDLDALSDSSTDLESQGAYHRIFALSARVGLITQHITATGFPKSTFPFWGGIRLIHGKHFSLILYDAGHIYIYIYIRMREYA